MKIQWYKDDIEYIIIDKDELSPSDKNQILKTYGKVKSIRVNVDSYSLHNTINDDYQPSLLNRIRILAETKTTFRIDNKNGECLQKDGSFKKQKSALLAKTFYNKDDAQKALATLCKNEKGGALKYTIEENI